ncbi:hypothetical protein NXT08_22390 [Rhodococcus pyridinivorans]|uniref:hypothetical protein n=1 Tax=Rhodococcus pyridinivorans TaxID=103816 RepID=UPI000BA22EB6|nr:hypothetical protein [Rhodococcus pyridinivorans]UVT24953.1 hypothetical protein NXT08_22390 [Rhodococcus pyridinivorans]
MSNITVSFDRVGRTHNPPDLVVPVAEVADPWSTDDGLHWGRLYQRIETYIRPMIRSSDPELWIETPDDASGLRVSDLPIEGWISVGGFRNAGSFTMKETVE